MERKIKSKFNGFPPGKVRFTPLPEPFFTDLLPQMDSIDEMKVVLYTFWVLSHRPGNIRYLRLSDYYADQTFMNSLNPDSEASKKMLYQAMTDAISRGVMLQMKVEGDPETYYFINTARSQAVYQSFLAGKWKPGSEQYQHVNLDMVRPNIFQLYEQNIGLLTPLLAEKLKMLEQEYPESWLAEAVEIAVVNNIRKLSYIEAVLKSWQERGKDDENRRDTQTNYRRYIEGEFARYVKH